MLAVLNITKALSDETRIRLLLALRGGELCVCQLIELVDLAPSTVSKHMSLLFQAGLAQRRKEGRWQYYRLPDSRQASPLVRSSLKWIEAAAGESPIAAQDRKRLAKICAREREAVSACCYPK